MIKTNDAWKRKNYRVNGGNDNDPINDFCVTLIKKIRAEINGGVVYEYYKNIDSIIIRTTFKEFRFDYAINSLTELVYNGNSDIVANEFLQAYRSAVLGAFFKTSDRKERDRKRFENRRNFL